MYQIIMSYTLNVHNVICRFYLYKAGGGRNTENTKGYLWRGHFLKNPMHRKILRDGSGNQEIDLLSTDLCAGYNENHMFSCNLHNNPVVQILTPFYR